MLNCAGIYAWSCILNRTSINVVVHVGEWQEGGLNGFLHGFIAEVMAVCRAHVAALGGNALVAYHMSECVLEANLHKNQVSKRMRDHSNTLQAAWW